MSEIRNQLSEEVYKNEGKNPGGEKTYEKYMIKSKKDRFLMQLRLHFLCHI